MINSGKFIKYMDISEVFLVLLNPDETILYANKYAAKLLGYKKEELVGMNWIDNFIPARNRKEIREVFKHTFPNYEKPLEKYKNPILLKNGNERILEWINSYEKNENDEVITIISTGIDVTEKTKIENQLRETMELFKLALEAGKEAVWKYDTEEDKSYFSDEWKVMLGFDRDEIIDDPLIWEKRIHPEDFERVNKDINDFINEKKDFYINEYRLRKKDSSYIWVMDRAKIISRTPEGQAKKLVGTQFDITERKRIELELSDIKEKYEFALSATGEGVWGENKVTGESFLSRNWLDLLGMTEKTVINKNSQVINTVEETEWEKVIHPDDKERVLKNSKKLHSGKIDRFEEEYRVKCKDGKYIWIMDRAKVVTKDSEGNPIYLIGTYQNIDDKKRAELELQDVKQKYEFALEATGDGVWGINNITGEAFLSSNWMSLLGLSEKEKTEETTQNFQIFDWISWQKRVHPDDIERVLKNSQKLHSGQINSFEEEYRIKCKNGRYIWVKDRAKVVSKDSSGNPLFLIGSSQNIDEKKKAEIELDKIRKRYEFAIAASKEGVWERDLCTGETYLSKSWKEMIGYNKNEVSNKNIEWESRIHPDDKKRVTDLSKKMHNGLIPYFESEYRIKCKDGKYIWILDRAEPCLKDLKGKPLKIIGTYQNIDNRKKMEREIEETKERYMFALEASGEGIWERDFLLDKTFFSNKWRKILGYDNNDSSEAFRIDWHEMIHPDDRKRAFDKSKKLYSGEIDYFELEYRIKRKTGEYIWILDKSKIVKKTPDGKPSKIIGTYLNIEKRKKMELDLQEAKERYEFAMQANREGIWEYNTQTKETYLSKRWKEILGFSVEEISDESDEWESRIHPDDKERVFKEYNKLLEGQSEYYEIEYRMKQRDGNYIWVIDRAKAGIKDTNSKAIKVVGTHQNIDNRKQMEIDREITLNTLIIMHKINDLINKINSKAALFRGICDILSEEGNYQFVWIGKVILDEHKSVKPIHYSGNDESYLRIIDISWDDVERGRGPVGKSVRAQSAIVNNNILEDPECKPWQKEFLKRDYKSIVSIPLEVEKDEKYTLTIYSNKKEVFKRIEVNLLNQLKNDIVIGLKNLNFDESLEKTNKRLNHLNNILKSIQEINRLITKEKNKHNLIQEITKILTSDKERRDSYILLFDDDFNLIDGAQTGDEKIFNTIVNGYKNGKIAKHIKQVIQEQSIVLIMDKDSCFGCPFIEECKRSNIIKLPIIFEDRLMGILSVSTKSEYLFDSEEHGLLIDLTEDISYALNNIDIYEKSLKASRELEESKKEKQMILGNISELIVFHDKNHRIKWVNKSAADSLGLSQEKMIGMKCHEAWSGSEIICENCPVEKSFKTKKTEYIEKMTPDGRYWKLTGTPVFDEKNKIIGAVEVGSDITKRKKAELEREKALSDLKIALEKNRENLEIIIKTVSKLVEMKDPYTAGHQRRVSDLAIKIAEKMKLEKKRVDAIRIAALLHDVGKIYIPSEILNKPIQLSKIEFGMIMEHPTNGYELFKYMKFDLPIPEYILQHHEKINGSGYPGGLKDDQIHLESRIICVADVVEAIQSHRPYRPAKGLEVAFEEIKKNSGMLYDKKVVESCLKVFEDGFKFDN